MYSTIARSEGTGGYQPTAYGVVLLLSLGCAPLVIRKESILPGLTTVPNPYDVGGMQPLETLTELFTSCFVESCSVQYLACGVELAGESPASLRHDE